MASNIFRKDIYLHAESLSLANDLQEEGITVISMDPGWVKTDMGGPMADIEVPESIAGQIKVFDALSLKDTGVLHGLPDCQILAVRAVTSSQ
jgi:NAD(P)-dependent dehydrogenase (short-subunit alcohol dehydrogenase family)